MLIARCDAVASSQAYDCGALWGGQGTRGRIRQRSIELSEAINAADIPPFPLCSPR